MFCKYCGKEIPEGQTCTCREAAPAPVEAQAVYAPAADAHPVYAPPADAQPVHTAPVAPAAPDAPAAPAAPAQPNKYVEAVKNAFKGMPAAFKRLVGNTFGVGCDMPSAIIFTCGGLLLHILAWVCLVGSVMGSMKDALVTMAGGLGALAGMDQMNQYISILFEGIYGMGVWAGCLTYAIPLAIGIAIPAIGQLVRKENVDIKHHFIVAANACFVPAALFFVGGLLSLVSFGLGAAVMVVAAVCGVIVAFKLLAKQMKTTNTLVGGLVAALIVTVAAALVVWAAGGAVAGYFKNTFVQNLAAIGFDLSDLTDLFSYFM